MQKIEFVRSRDFSARDLFEFGSGNSTLFWSARCGSVQAVEDDLEWREKWRTTIKAVGRQNASLRLVQGPADYVAEVGREGVATASS